MAHILDGFSGGFAKPTPPNVKLKALLEEFDASFDGEKLVQNVSPKVPPVAFKNAKPFTFMSAIPKKKDPEMAPTTAPTMAGP